LRGKHEERFTRSSNGAEWKTVNVDVVTGIRLVELNRPVKRNA